MPRKRRLQRNIAQIELFTTHCSIPTTLNDFLRYIYESQDSLFKLDYALYKLLDSQTRTVLPFHHKKRSCPKVTFGTTPFTQSHFLPHKLQAEFDHEVRAAVKYA